MLNTVLVVDDSDVDLLFAGIVLQRAGVAKQVLNFESVSSALAFLAQPGAAAVDLILLDIHMPGMDGFDFLRRHEADSAARGQTPLPVVMLSSSPDITDQERAARHACVRGYLVKPLSVEAARGLATHT